MYSAVLDSPSGLSSLVSDSNREVLDFCSDREKLSLCFGKKTSFASVLQSPLCIAAFYFLQLFPCLHSTTTSFRIFSLPTPNLTRKATATHDVSLVDAQEWCKTEFFGRHPPMCLAMYNAVMIWHGQNSSVLSRCKGI